MDNPSNQPSIPTTGSMQNNIATMKPKSNFKKIIIIISAIIGVIILSVVGILMFVNTATSAPLKISDQFVMDIQGNNAPAAYKLMSTEAQNATSAAEFNAMVDQMGTILTGKPTNTSKEINTSTDKGTSAKVIYEVTGNDNFTHVLTLNLVLENNEWKVLNFESVKK